VSEGRSRTGARRPPAPSVPPGEAGAPRRQLASYRGIRWRKDPDGTIGWFNEGRGGWVRWRPGTDAPPLPPRWEADAARIPVPPRVQRASWRSPYRLVPVALAVAVVVFGLVQTLGRNTDAAATADRDARALVGRCLAPGSHAGTYDPTPVACTSASARVRVLAVRAPTGRGSGCAAGETALHVVYAGVRTPDVECVRPVGRR